MSIWYFSSDFCHCSLYFSGVSNFLVTFSEIYFCTVIYNCRGNFEKWPSKPMIFMIINIITSIQYTTEQIHLLIIISDYYPGNEIIVSACKNSGNKVSQEFLDTQVIKSLCATQLVYPWIHINFLLMYISKMTDFYQNMEDSHPNLSTWVHIDVSVLHFFLSDIFCSGECLLMIFQQCLWKINMLIFWWNQLKHHNTFPHCHHSYSMFWQDYIMFQEHLFYF